MLMSSSRPHQVPVRFLAGEWSPSVSSQSRLGKLHAAENTSLKDNAASWHGDPARAKQDRDGGGICRDMRRRSSRHHVADRKYAARPSCCMAHPGGRAVLISLGRRALRRDTPALIRLRDPGLSELKWLLVEGGDDGFVHECSHRPAREPHGFAARQYVGAERRCILELSV